MIYCIYFIYFSTGAPSLIEYPLTDPHVLTKEYSA